MSASSYRRRAVVCASLALFSACAIDRAPITADCVQGRAVPCTCDDGSHGASTCAADGAFSACACAVPSSGGQGGAASPPAGGAAGIGGGGEGASGSSGQGVAAGDEALPAVDAGVGALDGMIPIEDGGVDASIDMPDSSIVEPPKPKPGEPYGPCRTDGTCGANLFCTLDSASGGTTTYCTMFCSVSGFGGAMCPALPSGSAGTCIANVCAR